MKIYRVPTPEEASVKNYRELYDRFKNIKLKSEKLFFMPNDPKVDLSKIEYPVFEFSVPELKEKLIEEYENFHKDLLAIIEARDGYSDLHLELFYSRLITKIKNQLL